MGYTVKPADEYIGLGLTSIGFLQNTFVHNHKALPEYYRILRDGKLPVERGKILTADDRMRQWAIQALMCRFGIDKHRFEREFEIPFDRYFQDEQAHLIRCAEDGLIKTQKDAITVTELGKIFVRNVCMGFDSYLQKKEAPLRYSRTV